VEKVRILFVDDEERLLSGLRRMLRDKRDLWDMTFASSGAEALKIMESGHFDVIVSDMRMPGMNGAQLLAEVRKKWPEMIRIILSGYAENEAVMQTVGLSHQYLAKPCDPELLKATISRTLNIQPYLKSTGLRQLVAGLRTLPVPSNTFTQLIAAIESEYSSLDQISKILRSDIALSTQILKLTRSAYFSLPQKTNDIDQAVRLLGFETIHGLATIANFFEMFKGEARHQTVIETLNQRSLTIGMLARQICKLRSCSAPEAETAYCAGLLAHIGTLVIIANVPDKFDEVVRQVEGQGIDIVSAEQQVFGSTHADLGAYLLGIWGFEKAVLTAVRSHHEEALPDTATSPAAVAVFMAQLLTRKRGPGQSWSADLTNRELDDLIASDPDVAAVDRKLRACIGESHHV